MTRILTITFLWSLSIASTSLCNVELAVVKTLSGKCDAYEKKFKGSGVLVKVLQKTYVLTSEHVMLNGKEGYCHYIKTETSNDIKASLVASDFGLGLALLEVSDSQFLERALDLSDFLTERDLVDRKKDFSAIGFPFANDTLYHDRAARLASISNRNELPLVKSSLEIIGQGDFGMSGGGLFLGEKFLGTLCHQVVSYKVGSPSIVSTFGPETKTLENRMIAIPAWEARSWISNVLSRGSEISVLLQQNVTDQLSKEKQSVIVRGMLFTMRARLAGEIGGGANGAGMGGGANGGGMGGTGGGANGAGMGGDGKDVPKDQIIEVTHLNIPLNGFKAVDQQPQELLDQLLRIRKLVRAGSSVKIYSVFQNFKPLPIKNLSEFFKALSNPDTLLPLADLGQALSPEIKSSMENAKLKIASLLKVPVIATSADTKSFLIALSNLAAVIELGDLNLVKLDQVKEMLGSKIWDQLFVLDGEISDDAIQLKAELLKLYQLIGRTRV